MPIDIDGNPIPAGRCTMHPHRHEPCIDCDFPANSEPSNGTLT